jgi:hypothetical protein
MPEPNRELRVRVNYFSRYWFFFVNNFFFNLESISKL